MHDTALRALLSPLLILEAIWVLGKALLLIVGVLLLARRVIPWVLGHVIRTRRQELFLLTVVAICFGTAAASSYAGVSLALGAFLAGLVVSESRYSEHALSEILPLRTIFNAVFFASVGMMLVRLCSPSRGPTSLISISTLTVQGSRT